MKRVLRNPALENNSLYVERNRQRSRVVLDP